MAIPFEIYEILMGRTRDLNPRKDLRIGATGNEGVASISLTVETIEGEVGRLAMAAAESAIEACGIPTELPDPNYGYLRSSAILHERIDNRLYNDWVGGNLDELTYVDRRGGTCQQTPEQRCACRCHMRYTR